MAAADREIPAEDSIKVVCRFRPLNDSEEKAGSKFVVKFPQGNEENCIAIGVSRKWLLIHKLKFSIRHEKKFVLLKSATPYKVQMLNIAH